MNPNDELPETDISLNECKGSVANVKCIPYIIRIHKRELTREPKIGSQYVTPCSAAAVSRQQWLKPTRGTFWKGRVRARRIFLNTRWTGAEAGTYGFVCGPDAIAQASRIPEIHPAVKRLLMESKTVTIENLGLTVQMNVWGSALNRTVWANFDLFYGASYGKEGAKSVYRIRGA